MEMHLEISGTSVMERFWRNSIGLSAVDTFFANFCFRCLGGILNATLDTLGCQRKTLVLCLNFLVSAFLTQTASSILFFLFYLFHSVFSLQHTEWCQQTRSEKSHLTSLCTFFGKWIFAYPMFVAKTLKPSSPFDGAVRFTRNHCQWGDRPTKSSP